MADTAGTSRPYRVVFAAQVEHHIAALPKQARILLADALELIRRSPWTLGRRYHERLPPEIMTATFGDGAGILAYVISEHRRLVIVSHVTWLG